MIKSIKNYCLALILACLATAFSVAGVSTMLSAKAYADGETYIKSAQVSLKDSIIAKFYVDVPVGYTDAEMTFTYKDIDYTQTKTVTGGQTATFAFDRISPQNMTETLSATVKLNGEGKDQIEETLESWSVESYCRSVLSMTAAALNMSDHQANTVKKLAVNLLNYGAKAQAYTNKQGALPTDELTEEQLALVESVIPESDTLLAGEKSENVAWSSAYLYFDSTVNLVFEFKVKNAYVEGREFAVSVGEATLAAEQTTVGEAVTTYKATLTNVSVVDFDDALTAFVTVDGAAEGKTLTYSVASYCAAMQGSENAAMTALATAVYNYGLTAAAYVNATTLQNVVVYDNWYKGYYRVGETFDKNGLVIGYEWADGEVTAQPDVAFTCDTTTPLTESNTIETVTVTVNGAEKSIELPIVVIPTDNYMKVEAETGTKSGLIETVTGGSTLDYASGRSYLRNFAQNSNVTYTIQMDKANYGSIRLYLSSHEDGYNGSSTTTYPLTPAEYMALSVNGEQVDFGKFEVLPSASGGLSRLCNWYAVTFDNCLFKAGANTIKLTSLVNMRAVSNLQSTAFDYLEILYTDSDIVLYDDWYKGYYVEGETFNTNGMKFAYRLRDGSHYMIDQSDVTLDCDTTTSLTESDTIETVTVTVNGIEKTIDLPIVVVPQSKVIKVEAEAGTKDGTVETVTSGTVVNYASNNSFLRNFAKGASVSFKFALSTDEQRTVSLRFYVSSHDGSPTMKVTLKNQMTCTLNGQPLAFGAYETVGGFTDDARGANSRLGHFEVVTFDGLTLEAGVNTVTFGRNDADAYTSVAFDYVELLYTGETPPALTESVTYQAEKQALSGITTAVKANGDTSGLFTHMEAAGDTDPGFVKNFTSGSTLKFNLDGYSAGKFKVIVYGSSTSNAVTKVSQLIRKITLNGIDYTLTDADMFPSWTTIGKTGAAAMADFQPFELGEFDFATGCNEFTITFKATEGAFIDKIVLEPVVDAEEDGE